MTQNANESFNGTIWNRVLKVTYVGLRQFEMGVYDAVAHFNIGSKAAILVYGKLGIQPGNHMLNACLIKNKSRITNARRQSIITKKTQRRYNRASKNICLTKQKK